MPDTRTHRGPDPRDAEAFGPAALPALRQAVSDLSWLLGRGYAIVSAVKLVGDRWSLTERQRLAVRRAACSDPARADRLARRSPAAELEGRDLLIDGFNVVTTVETALGGGVVLHCRDETYRDLAGIHGTYRKVAESIPALELIGARLSLLSLSQVGWLFDRPVSNSGRIRAMVQEAARSPRLGLVRGAGERSRRSAEGIPRGSSPRPTARSSIGAAAGSTWHET